MLIRIVALVTALQQGMQSPQGNTSPANGDTIGYWQQGVSYTIVATLDERAQQVHARAALRYVNRSPDALREMYVHQYLNAFRPGSKWSAVDEREGRVRFQHLEDPDFGYERFTAPVRVNGAPVVVDYPGAPDSTVAHFLLPSPLASGDSLLVEFAWDARPSTVPRRQGRRGRHWDLAQWYPKVAVYDRGGWEFNALQPAGEFYGEYGTYDVTLVLPQDEVVGATGVPVAGDPGWLRASRGGVSRAAASAYANLPPAPASAVPPGFKAVRFVARDVHHFAWSASPDYRYEGGVYVRELPAARWPTWDTVSIHVLYRVNDDTTWGGQRVVRRTALALQWLESIYGPYAYPQMTVLHRLDGGGTEFPMMQMNGSPSQGLILHEGGHVFTYGILGNNEWRSGWMDEGLTSFQTEWAQGQLPQERVRAGVVDQFVPARGYRAHAIRMAMPRFDATALDQAETDMRGESQAIGTKAQDFRDFGTYNDMIYTRAQVMYTQLRDVLGDTAFAAFLHDYYARWALRHVDERAMRASAERVSGRNLEWFFQQWVHETGVTDYRLVSARSTQLASGRWVTEAIVGRVGDYRHRIAVGARTTSGWTTAYAEHVGQGQNTRDTVRLETAERPLEVRLDPLHYSWDWDRRNDLARRHWFSNSPARHNVDWPFLAQADRDKRVELWRPLAWYSHAGGLNLGFRERSNYLGWVDQTESGLAAATRGPLPGSERWQVWTRFENPTIRGRARPGWKLGTAYLDDLGMIDLGYRRERPVRRGSLLRDVTVSWVQSAMALGGASNSRTALIPEFWEPASIDLSARLRWRSGSSTGSYWFIDPLAVGGWHRGDGYFKSELAVGRVQAMGDSRLSVRGYGGVTDASVPGQRALFVSSQDPVTTFMNHWWRPADAVLKQPGVDWLPLGGAALRGYHWSVAARDRVVGGNLDFAHQVLLTNRASHSLSLQLHAFADAANANVLFATPTFTDDMFSDAGLGMSVRGRLYDRPLFIRIDSPFYVSRPTLAIDQGHAGSGRVAPRWTITFNDLW